MVTREALEKPAQHKLRIYNYVSIGLATLIGGPAATAYMLSKNFKAFNQPDGIIVAWPVALLVEIGLFIVFLLDPDMSKLTFFIPLAYTAVALVLTKIFQARQMAKYYADGGIAFTYVRGVGIGLLILIITFTVLIIVSVGMLAIFGGPC